MSRAPTLRVEVVYVVQAALCRSTPLAAVWVDVAEHRSRDDAVRCIERLATLPEIFRAAIIRQEYRGIIEGEPA